MHYGKPNNDICKYCEECSSKQCTHGTCDFQDYGLSDNEGVSSGINEFIQCSVIEFIILIICRHVLKTFIWKKYLDNNCKLLLLLYI